ncbi:MAG: hypothetical protein IJD01_02080 [Clostridia bacterium]|nr:hypothetical protein [Clostridia bacterium]
MIEIKCAANERSDGRAVYEMTSGDEVIGTAEVQREGDTVTVLRCEAPDTSLIDALFRATLNAERGEGAEYALAGDRSVAEHAAKKGYSADFSREPLNIKEFFSKFVCKG